MTDAQVNALTIAGKQTTYTYMNGLGTPMQQVTAQGSTIATDVIQIYQNDQFGGQSINYLPYINGNSTTGAYDPSALTDQQSYYINSQNTGNAPNDPFPFNQKLFENSPLHRLLAAGNTGLGFQPNVQDNNQHYTTIYYRTNSSTDNVMISPVTSGTTYYQQNVLSVTDAKDADGVETLIFKNSAGQTLLKRQVSGQAQAAEPYFDTYYVYNPNGSIEYIIPPKATHMIATGASTNVSATPLSNLIYAYTYDALGRVITRKVPNSGVVSIVYDPTNRPLLIQDGNQALTTVNEWYYIKYDSKNRPISQGVYQDNTNQGRAVMQQYVNNNYGTNFYESRSSSSANLYYTNNCFPSQNIQPLAFAFYDDYDLLQTGSPNLAYQIQGLVNSSGVNIEATPTSYTRGMLTVVLKRSVGTGLSNIWLTNAYFYDKHSNVIQVLSNNHLNYSPLVLTDTRTIAPDFVGKPLQTMVVKVTGTSSNPVTNKVLTSYTYDRQNVRIQSISQTYNNQTPVTLAYYSYNPLGQLVTKSLGYNATTSAYLQTLDYRYNIRGQLLTINNSTLSNDGGITNNDNTDLFGMTYLYDGIDPNLGTTHPSYTGRISAVKWISKYNNGASVSNERSYVYHYDQLGQLNSASYAERLYSSSSSNSTTVNTAPFNVNVGGFNETAITYDDDGNITALQRNSSTNNGSGGMPLDNLTYSYDSVNPDRLYQVSDKVATISSYGFNNTANAPSASYYQYDADGNLTNDPYKGISISYDLINKTDVITAPNISNSTINYTYDASGTVLRKQVYKSGTSQSITDYLDEFVYINGTLAYFSMPEGRVVNASGTFKPEYIITDQQGNARFSFQDNGSGAPLIVQENSYYGFGAVMPGSLVTQLPSANNNNYLYNGGSEWQNTFGNIPDYYQTGSRNYDPELGRFISVDPIAEASESMSVYHYAMNNPIMGNDPTGNDCNCGTPGNGGGADQGANNNPDTNGSGSVDGSSSNTEGDTGAGGGGDPNTNYSNGSVPSSSTALGGSYNNGDGLGSAFYGLNYTLNTDGSSVVSNVTFSSLGLSSQTGLIDGYVPLDAGIANDVSNTNLALPLGDSQGVVQSVTLNEVVINGGPVGATGVAFQINSMIDLSMTGTDAILQGSQKIAYTIAKENTKILPLEKVPILGELGTLAAGIQAGYKINQFIHDPRGHWLDGLEGFGTVGVAIFAPEFLIGYSVFTTGVDLIRDHYDK